FAPEFRNRLDAIIKFQNLNEEVIEKIVDKFIDQLESQLEEKKITIELDSSAKLTLARKGFDPVFGARPLARVIQEDIKKPLADKILFGDLSNGGHIRITVKKDIFKFDISLNTRPKEKSLS
ncbi:MAG: ATP-dependent Clp protease ATP-binding subunit ClpA, partial [Alphaproteobacteria bacterium]